MSPGCGFALGSGKRAGGATMQYVCDVPGAGTWFRLETEAEAAQESALMGHAVEKHYRRSAEQAACSFDPSGIPFIEQEIARRVHVERSVPVFLSLRDDEGSALVTAMVPPRGRADAGFRCIVVGRGNADPYPDHGDAIEALARHFKLSLDREACYPYRRD